MAASVIWTKDEVFKLIELYQAHPTLWDINNTNSSKNASRVKCLKELQGAFDHRYTVNEINTKLKVILCPFLFKELRQMKNSTNSGSDTDNKVKWPFYDALDTFLRAQITPRQQVSHLDLEDEDETDEPSGIKKKKANPAAEKVHSVDTLTPVNSKTTSTPSQVSDNHPEDEETVFCKYLANELRKVKDPVTRNNIKLKLQFVIFEGQQQTGQTSTPIWRQQDTGTNVTIHRGTSSPRVQKHEMNGS